MSDKSLQQYADETLEQIGLPQFKQPLKNLIEVFEQHGWEIKRDGDSLTFPPNLMIKGIPGLPFSIYEPETGKFARDVTGPLGDNIFTPDDVASPTPSADGVHTWIAGVRAPNDPNNDPIEKAFATEATLEGLTAFLAKQATAQLMAILAAPPPSPVDVSRFGSKVGIA